MTGRVVAAKSRPARSRAKCNVRAVAHHLCSRSATTPSEAKPQINVPMRLSFNSSSRSRAAIIFALAFHCVMCMACASVSRESPERPKLPASERRKSYTSRDAMATRLASHEITPDALPPPKISGDVDNPPRVVAPPAGAELNMPPGFVVSTFAEGGFRNPRWMALAPNGDVFLADSDADSVVILRDADGDGAAEQRFTFSTDLNKPFGMGFWHGYFYVGNTNAVVRFRYQPGQTRAEGVPEKIADLPGKGYREHWTRNLQFNPSGTKLYVTIGSESNADVEAEPRASILEFNPDGGGRRTYASGLRNPVGMAFRPGANVLWAAVQERDRMGDDLPPDYVTQIREGAFYGWPYSYIGRNVDPRHEGARPDLVRKTTVPDVLLQAHSAVLGLVFYEGKMFPEEYLGDAFVAMHGSWNRSKRTGYKIVRIRFKGGRPVGGYQDFITGWMLDENNREVWGRPVGLLILPDGSMLVTDDGADKIWRVTYEPPGGATGNTALGNPLPR
jgi:glucose/arabinose dehydrogenase